MKTDPAQAKVCRRSKNRSSNSEGRQARTTLMAATNPDTFLVEVSIPAGCKTSGSL